MQAIFNQDTVIRESVDGGFAGELLMRFAVAADEIPAWGSQPAERDRQLREFWPTEPVLASALPNMVMKYASLGWSLLGPPRTVSYVQRQLQYSEFGRGLSELVTKVVLDLFTQDNGAFIEVVRAADSPDSPWISLNHLDSSRCVRTGNRAAPVTYWDNLGKPHLLKYYQVLVLTEMPSPIERMRGMQYCAVTRMLRAAQIMRDISIYEREKVSGRFTRAIHFISGISRRGVEDALARADEEANNERLVRYLQPVIVSTLDPTSQVTKQTIEMASLPDHFDKEQFMRWYINQLALAFGVDFQEFAPLPAGNLGTSQQSQILHLKSRGKGPAVFMSMFERALNFQGVLPGNVRFRFGEQDADVDLEKAELRLKRAQERAARIASGEITPQIARQLAVDVGDLREEYLTLFEEQDLTAQQHTLSGSDSLG